MYYLLLFGILTMLFVIGLVSTNSLSLSKKSKYAMGRTFAGFYSDIINETLHLERSPPF